MQIMLCAISNISSGGCAEDCKFCTQSVYVKTDIKKYKRKSEEEVLKEAKIAKANQALGFCLVSAGASLDDAKTDYVCSLARAINKEKLGLMLIGCNGLATKEQLKELKNNGVFSYNHNLESSKEFYPQICSSHSWEQRFETNLNAKEAGLELCCGGIYGLGESEANRLSFRASLKELKPFSSPINFFISNPKLNYHTEPLSADEALQIVQDSRKDLGPNVHLMVAGGREHVLKERQYEIFERGANAIVIGDYLTVSGALSSYELKHLREKGFSFIQECH